MVLVQPRAKIVATGQTTFSLVSTSANISLGKTFPSTAYTVYYRLVTGVGVQVPQTSNQTTTSFTASIGVGIAATVAWIAIEN